MSPASSPDSDPGQLRLAVMGLSKRYRGVRALDEMQLELRPGEVMAVLGENGAGKSTLVKILAGLVAADAGSIKLDGEEIGVFPTLASRAAGIAVVHQEFSLVPSMTVAENLALEYSRRAFGVWWPSALARSARPLLTRVGLEHVDPRVRVEKLTIAERQLLEVARVLSRDARVVIFDEPTAALSDADVPRVLRIIRSLAAEGRSVLFITHRLREVFDIADRATVLRNGRSMPPVDVSATTSDQLIGMILGRAPGAMYPPRPNEIAEEELLTVTGLEAPGLSGPVNLRLRRGEIVGLTGQVGSGANVVIQALAGRVPRIAGDISVQGEPLRSHNRRSGIRRRVAYCTADRKRDGIFAERPVTQNLSSPWLRLVSRFGWLGTRQERQKAAESAAAFAVDPSRLGSRVGTLSGGNQQKVALGKWLGIDPLVLLVEEPTRGVDVGARAEIYSRIRALCQSGLGVIMASSDTAEIHGFCDTIAAFHRGRLTAVKPASEWSEDELVSEVMNAQEPLV